MSATSRAAAKLAPPSRCAGLAALALISLLGSPATAAQGLDVASLRVRLKDTPAIGLIAKLRLKTEIEDLLGDLATFHRGRASESLDAIHTRYSGLVGRVVAMLERGDAPLARDLRTSTDHLWSTLADPGQFASLAQS